MSNQDTETTQLVRYQRAFAEARRRLGDEGASAIFRSAYAAVANRHKKNAPNVTAALCSDLADVFEAKLRRSEQA